MKYYILSAAILFTVASCEKDVTVNIPKEDPKLVMNGLLNNNSIFRVTISKSLSILAPSGSSTGVTNATVNLYENGLIKDTLVYSSTSGLYSAKNNTRVVAGNTYTLKAGAAGFTTVEAQTPAPVAVPVINITRRQNVRADANGTSYDEVRFSFADNSAAGDYYLVKLRTAVYINGNTAQYEGVTCFKSSDKDIDRNAGADPTDFENCINNEFLMADKNFNGNLKEIILFVKHDDMQPLVHPTNGRTYKPVIEFHHITQEHYRYRKSYTTYLDAEDNPFAEPVLVYGNVKNGYGIFSAFNLVRDTIR